MARVNNQRFKLRVFRSRRRRPDILHHCRVDHCLRPRQVNPHLVVHRLPGVVADHRPRRSADYNCLRRRSQLPLRYRLGLLPLTIFLWHWVLGSVILTTRLAAHRCYITVLCRRRIRRFRRNRNLNRLPPRAHRPQVRVLLRLVLGLRGRARSVLSRCLVRGPLI